MLRQYLMHCQEQHFEVAYSLPPALTTEMTHAMDEFNVRGRQVIHQNISDKAIRQTTLEQLFEAQADGAQGLSLVLFRPHVVRDFSAWQTVESTCLELSQTHPISILCTFPLNMLRPESRHLEVVRQTHPHMWVGRDPHLIKVGA